VLSDRRKNASDADAPHHGLVAAIAVARHQSQVGAEGASQLIPPMVAHGEHELMANRSDRRQSTLLSVRACAAAAMIREPGTWITIGATAITKPRFTGQIYDYNRCFSLLLPFARGRGPYMTNRKASTCWVVLQIGSLGSGSLRSG
jgi:hypothetical protein